MPGMKRFVTYIYSYENEVKGSNAGFAKFEVRGGEGRFEIHLRGLSGRTACKIYFFRLNGKSMEGFYIGEFRIMNGAGDFAAIFKADQIGQSAFGFSDMEGIVIFGEDRRMFLSRWVEGESFTASREYFYVWKPQESDNMDQNRGNSDSAAATVNRTDKTGKSAGRAKGVGEESEKFSAEQAKIAAENDRTRGNAAGEAENPVIENGNNPEEMKNPAAGAGSGMSGIMQPEVSFGQMTGEKEKISKDMGQSSRAGKYFSEEANVSSRETTKISWNADVRRSPGAPGISGKTEGQKAAVNPNTQNDMVLKSGSVQPPNRETNQIWRAEGEKVSQNVSENRNKETAAETSQVQADYGEFAAAGQIGGAAVNHAQSDAENVAATEIPMRNIFPQYTWREVWDKLQPDHIVYRSFESEQIQCMRIELKDLRELPRQYWYLGNNSFLLHGFFNYHYLVLGRNQEQFFIGVPGIFQRQEHVMAIIFGFPEFLPTVVKENESAEKKGENAEPINRFGFWIHNIDV